MLNIFLIDLNELLLNDIIKIVVIRIVIFKQYLYLSLQNNIIVPLSFYLTVTIIQIYFRNFKLFQNLKQQGRI
jgi:hypothetical protein